jgi:hypothetical protein
LVEQHRRSLAQGRQQLEARMRQHQLLGLHVEMERAELNQLQLRSAHKQGARSARLIS